MVKPTAVAGWAGLGWEMGGIPTLTRIIRGITIATGSVASGVVAGAFSGSIAGAIEGTGNAIFFNNGKDIGKNALFGALGGGFFGGVTGGVAAWAGGKNVWTGSPKANGLPPFSTINDKILREQGWTKLKNGRWQNIGFGDRTFWGQS